MSKGFTEFFIYGIIVAGLLVLVRPGSQGAGFVKSVGGALTNFVQAITGQRVTKTG